MTKQTILTGIKPTGTPHLGNYLGMIKPALEMCAANAGYDNYLFIANYHSLNSVQNAREHQNLTYELAATLLGCGLDPEQTTLFRESDVPEIAELTNFLMYICPKGLMNRAHAYKAAQDENRSKGIEDDSGIYMGLYVYPILMAADILAFETTHVPVGKDQVQHVEIARDIAGYFNNTFGQTLVLPTHVVQPDVATVPGLDGRKMSKSYDNVVPIFAPEKEIIAAVKRIVTDSLRPEEPKDPETNNVYLIYKAIADKTAVADMAEKFKAGKMGYGEAKQLLADRIIAEFKDRYARFEHYRANKAEIDAVFAKGVQKARTKAQQVLVRVKRRLVLTKAQAQNSYSAPDAADTSFDDYQKYVDSTIVRESANKLEFIVLALCGEAGELAEKTKKWMRGDYDLTPEVRASMAKELGDILWHISRASSLFGYSFSDVVRMNNRKLTARLNEDKIGGEGDNR